MMPLLEQLVFSEKWPRQRMRRGKAQGGGAQPRCLSSAREVGAPAGAAPATALQELLALGPGCSL